MKWLIEKWRKTPPVEKILITVLVSALSFLTGAFLV